MEITLTIPDELATRLQPIWTELPAILELGIREWNARGGTGFAGIAEVLETLASLPAPEDVLALRPADSFQERIEHLLEKSHKSTLTADEQREWEQYQYVEHLVRLAKARGLETATGLTPSRKGACHLPRRSQAACCGSWACFPFRKPAASGGRGH